MDFQNTSIQLLPLIAFLIILVGCSFFYLWNIYVLIIPVLLITLLVIRRAEYLALFLVVLTLTISYPSYPLLVVPFMDRGFTIIELVTLAFFLRALWATAEVGTQGIRQSPVGRAFLLYLGWLALSVCWHVLVEGNTSVNATRGYFIAISFFPLATLLRTDRQWFTLFKGMYVLAIISGIVALLMFFQIGDTSFWTTVTGSFLFDEFAVGDSLGPPRVALGGLYLAYSLAIVSVVSRAAKVPVRTIPFAFVILCVVLMVISFTRAILFTFLAGVCIVGLFAMFSRQQFLSRARSFGVLIFIIVFAGTVILNDWLGLSSAAERFLVLFQLEGPQDITSIDSMSGREWENAIAAEAIIQDPLFGGGFGRSFLEEERFAASAVPHNAYVSLMFLFGVPGLLFFLLVAVQFLRTARKLLLEKSGISLVHKSWLLGFCVSFVGLFLASFAAQYITVKAAVLVSIMLAYCHFLWVKTSVQGSKITPSGNVSASDTIESQR